jgi:hypothetical protein
VGVAPLLLTKPVDTGGRFHAPAALPPVSIEFEALCTPQPVCAQWTRRILTQCRTRIGQNFGIYYEHLLILTDWPSVVT